MSKRICVFCSAATGLDPMFFAQAERFCEGLRERGWELVYGAAASGLMGHFADEAIKRKVPVRGAIPETLEASKAMGAQNEGMHRGLDEVVRTKDLFERKRWMMNNSDAFAIFPGGFGTLDEALEMITWKMLGELDKPILFVDLKGYWRAQLKSYEEMARAGAIRKEALELYGVCGSVEALFAALDLELK